MGRGEVERDEEEDAEAIPPSTPSAPLSGSGGGAMGMSLKMATRSDMTGRRSGSKSVHRMYRSMNG